LETVIPYQETPRGHRPVIHRQKLVASAAPWHSTAAMLAMELDAEIRRLEVHMKERVSGILSGRRGGSKQNTHHALKSVANLAEAVDDEMVLGVLNKLDRWVRRADAVFNPENGLHRIPREPGEKEARCPYCSLQTMRWHPGTGIAICVNPACLTEDKVRPRWSMGFVVVDDALKFTWKLCEAVA
jgi:hypothetical protein